MARFIDEPLKNPLAGNEVFAATDPNTMDDVGITPLIITQFVATSMSLASGSDNGLISGPERQKLDALDTEAGFQSKFDQLAQSAIPVFFGTPVDGFLELYYQVLDVPWVIPYAIMKCSAGSTLVSISKNGTPIPGFTAVAVGTSNVGPAASGPVLGYTFNVADVLGITLASTSGDCANLRISIKVLETIT